MTAAEVQKIRTSIDEKKRKNDRAEGAIESIQQEWKRQFGFETIEEAQNKLKELGENADLYAEQEEKIVEQLKELVNWENL